VVKYQAKASIYPEVLGISEIRFIGPLVRRFPRLPNRTIILSYEMRDENGKGVFDTIGHRVAVFGQDDVLVLEHDHSKDWSNCKTSTRLESGFHELRVYLQS